MPYECSAGDPEPVVVHLQQLDGDYDQVDFCADHWVQFIAATAVALGLYDPGDIDGIDPDARIGLTSDLADPDGDPTGAGDFSLDGGTGAYGDDGDDPGAVIPATA